MKSSCFRKRGLHATSGIAWDFVLLDATFHRAIVKVPTKPSADHSRLGLEMEFWLRCWHYQKGKGRRLRRDAGKLVGDSNRVFTKRDEEDLRKLPSFDVSEERFFVRLEIPRKAPGSAQSPFHLRHPFSLTILEDGRGTDPPPATPERWARAQGLSPCHGAATGIAQFLAVLLAQVEVWEANWEESLDMMEKDKHVPMANFTSERELEDLMYDTSFKGSTSNFIDIQLLRTANRYVDDARLSARSLEERFNFLSKRFDDGRGLGISPADWAEVMGNVEYTTKYIQGKTERLLDRIKQNSEGIKSLQDGVSRTTAPTPLSLLLCPYCLPGLSLGECSHLDESGIISFSARRRFAKLIEAWCSTRPSTSLPLSPLFSPPSVSWPPSGPSPL